jgi:hypothetical protein
MFLNRSGCWALIKEAMRRMDTAEKLPPRGFAGHRIAEHKHNEDIRE